MKKEINQNVFIGIVVYAFVIYFYSLSTSLPEASATFPLIVLGLIAVLNTIIFVNGIRRTRRQDKSGQTVLSLETFKGPAMICLCMIGYAVLFRYLGYFIATPILFVTMLVIYRYRNYKWIVIVTVGFVLLAYVLFVRVLHIPLA